MTVLRFCFPGGGRLRAGLVSQRVRPRFRFSDFLHVDAALIAPTLRSLSKALLYDDAQGTDVASIGVLAACTSGVGTVPPAQSSENDVGPLPDRNSMWSLILSPKNPPGSDGDYDDTLYVSGTSSQDVWAVGCNCCVVYSSKLYYEPVTEHWNGSAWKLTASASDTTRHRIRGVAALSPNDAWAVRLR